MNDRIYNRIANTLMLIGIGSALLFDSGKFPHAVVGGIGILAGIGALALYFCNKREAAARQETDGKEEVKAVANGAVVVRDRAAARPVRRWQDFEADYQAIEAYRRATAQLWLSHYASHGRKLRWQVIAGPATHRALMEPEVELSPNEVAACVVEIIRNIAAAEDLGKWEYDFGPKGLRISLKRGYAVRGIAVPQEDFDFVSAHDEIVVQ